MNKQETTRFLTELFAGVPSAAQFFESALKLTPVVDAAGRGPQDAGYVETFDPWLAAAEVATWLAITLDMAPEQQITEVSSEGTRFKVEQRRVDWADTAQLLRSRSPLVAAAGMAAIILDTPERLLPRSWGHQ